MQTPDEINSDRQLCSLYTRDQDEDPIGTAGCWNRIMVLEAPLPWPEDITGLRGMPIDTMAVLRRAAKEKVNVRFLAVAADKEYSRHGYTRVINIVKPKGSFATYQREEYVVAHDTLGGLLEALLFNPENLPIYASARQDISGVRDLFICTHGAVDACCGKFGFPLYKALRHRYPQLGPDKLRVWRTSHFGGHRFAPTVMDMPEGRFWAHISPEKLDALVLRQGSFSELSRNYRGWGGADRITQLAERAAFEAEGWDWISYGKAGRIVEKDDAGRRARVEIRYVRPDGVSGTYEAHIKLIGVKQHNHCLHDAQMFKVNQYEVTRLEKTVDNAALTIPLPTLAHAMTGA